ncbi:MAG: 50S ribosomal protein L29 [Thermoproteota archaeon]|nr:50S ribosomal protein L29 [Nitrosopumilaceae archaeon]HSF28115.1 50S ribosomal protein L29 [Nitrosopumilaceae archaeon]
MARLKMKTVREFNETDLKDRLGQLRTELGKLRVESSKGTLRKENGKVRAIRRDIARILTRLGEMKKQ